MIVVAVQGPPYISFVGYELTESVIGKNISIRRSPWALIYSVSNLERSIYITNSLLRLFGDDQACISNIFRVLCQVVLEQGKCRTHGIHSSYIGHTRFWNTLRANNCFPSSLWTNTNFGNCPKFLEAVCMARLILVTHPSPL